MKKLYSFVILTMLMASFSMTATAQHYVRVNNDTKSTNGRILYANSILPTEIADTTSVMYIHIIKVKNGLNTGGVENGRNFLITKFSPILGGIHFNDDTNKDRCDCFTEGEILVRINDDFVPYKDIKFVSSTSVVLDNTEVFNTIKSQCVYDENSRKLDLTKCQFDYIYNGVRHRGDSQYNVSSDSKIEFITGSQNIPNIVLEANTFVQPQADADKLGEKVVNNGVYKYWKEILIVLLLILAVVLFLKRRGKGKYSEKRDKRSKKHGLQGQVTKEISNNNPVVTQEISASVVDEKLHLKLADVLARIETTQNAVSKQTATLESIKLLVSNTEDKKQLAQKIQELEAEKKKSANAIAQRDAALSDIEKLKGNIAQLQAGSQIEGALQVAECSAFVAFAKKVISECAEAENLAIKYWSSLNSKDQQILNGFLSKFHMTKCCIDLAKWNGIIATLDLKGYIKNDEYITYLTSLSDKDRMIFLNKRFFEDILRPYVGAVILFLEQIRTANKIGVSVVCNDNIDGFINSICTRCHEQGVFIDYRKLYEKVTEYDSLEIDENVPEIIKKVIAKVEEEDTLLYVDKYAVNLKSGEMAEKTRCYIKI
ncbi:MAG: hypothetical protein IJ998_06935 [Alistipes sp.]|nr:hypothetical protein [Alistipes sp.]